MNAIVAIGGAALFRVVNAYRTLVPSEVWALGIKTPRDVNDPLLRSLELLVEPFLGTYYEGEVRARFAETTATLATHPLPASELDPQSVYEAVAATFGRSFAPAMALVDMLDRAHATSPIELVLADDNSGSAYAAVAWARARGLPAVVLPESAPVRQPSAADPASTIVIGDRARRSYQAIGFDESLLQALPAPDPTLRVVPEHERDARRIEAKDALTRALGWQPEDVVIVFEPASFVRDSALERADAFDTSVAAMFAGFRVARAQLPTLRLVVATMPQADGFARAAQAAESTGLASGDFAYTVTNHDIWFAGADVVVSVESTRSIEAALSDIPAINLWRPSNWYRGPAFGVDDGVVEVPAQTLGASLVAVLSQQERRQPKAPDVEGGIAGDAPASPGAALALAQKLVERRRAATGVARKPRPDIVVWAPDYTVSGGIRALHRLCHFINLAGGDAWMYPPTKMNPDWNTPRRDTPITDRTIVVYPEIVFNPAQSKRVVRWVLNYPGLLGGPTTYDRDEMVFYYAPGFRAAAQAATTEVLTDERELPMSTVEPELFFNDRSRPRLYDCVYVGKGDETYKRMRLRETRDAYVIQRGVTLWPANRLETAAMLRGCRRLYTFDQNTAIVTEALMCGVQAYYVRENGDVEEHIAAPTDISDYVQHYYDLTDVERFLRLISERWD